MDRVIPFLEKAHRRQRPFFCIVWFHTPHKPLPDPDEVADVDSRIAYRHAVQNMDRQIGRMRARLTELQIHNNTMIWFCSDNGPERGVGQTGGLRQRKRSLYEGGVRVPALLEWPDRLTGRSTDFVASTSDYYPTILDLLGIAVPHQRVLDGVSLRVAIDDSNATRVQPVGFLFGKQQSWIGQRHKIISTDGGRRWELYDLVADRAERDDKSDSEGATLMRLKTEYVAWKTDVEREGKSAPCGALTWAATVKLAALYEFTFAIGVGFPMRLNDGLG